jgi:ATP-binding cassette subfamily B protein
LVRRPEIYLFDDAFSALDYTTDAALRQALAAETSDATVVIVAQRVSTIRDAHRIIVLDEGAVVGTGTHAELMAINETYREIVLSQLTEAEANR